MGKHVTTPLPPTKSELAAPRILRTTLPDTPGANGSSPTQHSRLFVWSASEESGLKRLSDVYSKHLRGSLNPRTPDFLANLSYTLSEKRSNLPWKAFAVADSVEILQTCLDDGLSAPVRASRAPKLGFIFTGQGAQWYAMGRELFEYPIFKDVIDEAGQAFQSFGCSWNLIGNWDFYPSRDMR